MPFNNRLQFDRKWDFTIPIILCTFLGLAACIDLLIRITIFWNLPNRNFNTFIAQLTFTSNDESWEDIFIDVHIDRLRSDRANPTPGRSPHSDTLQYVRNLRSHPDAPPEPQEDSSDEEQNATEETGPAPPQTEAEVGMPIPGPPNYRTSQMSYGDTVPNTPEHPTTPLEDMEEDDMHRIHPTLPSNAELNAAGDNGILLTDEQHRVLTSQSEGSTILYRPREHRQREDENDPRLTMSGEERVAISNAHSALQMAAGSVGTNANPGPPRITDLVRPEDPPILRAFAEELENWPELDQFLEGAFRER